MQIGDVSKQTTIFYDMEEFNLALVNQSHVLKLGK